MQMSGSEAQMTIYLLQNELAGLFSSHLQGLEGSPSDSEKSCRITDVGVACEHAGAPTLTSASCAAGQVSTNGRTDKGEVVYRHEGIVLSRQKDEIAI